MSRKNLADKLMEEVYAATHYDRDKFKPMDPRRCKRMSNLVERTDWNSTETDNRLAGAFICSRDYRKEKRK